MKISFSSRGRAGDRALAYLTALIGCGVVVSLSSLAWAQTAIDPVGPSYKERRNPRLSKSGPIDADPNVYVYTAEFAKRFQMPEEWVSAEINGVDAVAFRVIPSPYKTCGWGGDPKACNSSEVRCEIDLYFDHKRNPLPWDERRSERYSSPRGLSVNFLANYLTEGNQNYPIPAQRLRRPARQDDHVLAKSSPFVDPRSGKGLEWQYFTSLEKRSGWGWRGILNYDKEIFTGMALVTLSTLCDSANAVLALASNGLDTPFNPTHPDLTKYLLLPSSWQARVKQAQQESNDRAAAFFKQEGEKALKALRESPVPNKSIVPVQ